MGTDDVIQKMDGKKPQKNPRRGARRMLKMDDKDGDGKISWEEFSGDKGKGWGTTNRSTTTTTPRKPMKIPIVVEDKKPSEKKKKDTKTSEKTQAKTKTSKKNQGQSKILSEKTLEDGTIISEKDLGDGTVVRTSTKGKRPAGATTIQSEL